MYPISPILKLVADLEVSRLINKIMYVRYPALLSNDYTDYISIRMPNSFLFQITIYYLSCGIDYPPHFAPKKFGTIF